MFLPGPPSSKDDLDAFSRLQNWPKLAITFKTLVQNATDGPSELRTFPNPVFTLMHMAARNNVATKYLAIEENFLLAAIHIAAMKNFPYNEGTLPDLPANMPPVPPGGFKDQDSYDRFEVEFNAFIKKCRTEGTPSSAAHVGSRSPFQLAVMISPLYLLVTKRLSTKSFHRRTVIDLAARLGPHKPRRVLAVESAIWDALFRLAEGRISAYSVLRDLADSLPWSDVDNAENCEADKQWFATRLPMQYNPAISIPQMRPSHFIGPSPMIIMSSNLNAHITQHQCSLLPPPSVTGNIPSILSSTVPPTIPVTCADQEPQVSPVSPPLSQGLHDSTVGNNGSGQAVDMLEAFNTAQISLSPNFPPPSPLQPTRTDQWPMDVDVPGNFRIISRIGTDALTKAPFLYNASNLGDSLRNNGSRVFRSHSSSDTSCDLDRNKPAAHSTSNSMAGDLDGPDLPRPAAQGPDDDESNWSFTNHNTDTISNFLSSTDNLDKGRNHFDNQRRKTTEIGNTIIRNLQRSSEGFSDDDAADVSSDSRTFKKPMRKDTHLHPSSLTRPSNSSGTPSNSDDADPDEAARFLSAKDHNTSAKRRRSPSTSSLGNERNPIDVDNLVSLFEPIVIRDYVKREEISLSTAANSPIKGNRTYTIFDVKGEPTLVAPSFHFRVYHERFRQFFERVEAFYEHGQPLHIARPSDSIIKTFTYEAWKALTPAQMQQEQRKKNIVVSGWPLEEQISFDEHGLRKVAGTHMRQISINGDVNVINSCRDQSLIVSGHVRDIWDNRLPSKKILNALDLPLYDGNTEATEITSELHAWDVTRGHHCIDPTSSYPTEHMRWALAGHENAITFLHIDCEGLSTDITVADGGKAWGFLRERHGNPLSSINFFLKDGFRLDQVLPSSDYDFELVVLRPRDKLFMMPCQPHFVFGLAHSICIGGHYYLTNHMKETLQGLIHSFVLHKFLTNTSHPTRVLLRRLILFYHMGLLEDEIPESDPAASHLPNINNIDGLMDLLSACVLVVLGNVLDFRTYRAPNQEEYTKANKNQQILIDHEINTIPVSERFATCYARGVALRLINWIRRCSVITGPRGDVVRDLPSRFFVQIAQTLIKYKEGANASKLDLQANCTLSMLIKQINNVVDVDPLISSLWRDSERRLLPSDSLALADQDGYSVQWLPDAQREWSCLPYDFFHDGVTGLDEQYFRSQQDRQQLEASVLVPQLKRYSSASQYSSKRTRSG
ncbi:hypothetical protein BDN70DRAFT_937616 [Pholiota conissans]|uniref:Uncharacterized protein n=1 Tax=Pholiota conissans TaxID=109636 RepID=A0A9P5YT09_9AGAR|nr:hypothetical protein BDN70DRAFT_937616 [Pholiota conissans]